MWSSIYRICEMNRKRTDRESKDAQSKNIHAHLLDGGYSSTDDYDRQLVFRFQDKATGESAAPSSESRWSQNNTTRSAGDKEVTSNESLAQPLQNRQDYQE